MSESDRNASTKGHPEFPDLFYALSTGMGLARAPVEQDFSTGVFSGVCLQVCTSHRNAGPRLWSKSP